MSEQSFSLKGRVFKAGGWVVGGFVGSQVIRLGGNLILRRLLFPEVYGLMAVVYLMRDPRRLWKRYLVNDTQFIRISIIEWFHS